MSHHCSPISSKTRLLAVIGHPVSHSLSPLIHNAALASQGVAAVYVAFDVVPDELQTALLGLRAVGFWGANVTIPHKERAAGLVDKLDPAAATVGAVNTIVNRSGVLEGYNSDIAGFAKAVTSVRPSGVAGSRCLVLGAGGAARAVVAALLAGGAGEVFVHNRTRLRAERLCEEAQHWSGGGSCQVASPGSLADIVASATIVVNATSIGLDSSVKESPVPVDILDSHHVVVDLVYGPQPTSLVRAANARGAAAVDGLEMLLAQAAVSYQLWTGLDAPVEVMRASLEQAGR